MLGRAPRALDHGSSPASASFVRPDTRTGPAHAHSKREAGGRSPAGEPPRELGYPAPPERVAERLRGLVARLDCGVLVSEEEHVLLGLGCVHVFPVIHMDEQVALLTALVVANEARRGGHGRRLVRALEDFARAGGSKRMLVTTANQRADAHAFYERLGYTFTGRRYAKQPL